MSIFRSISCNRALLPFGFLLLSTQRPSIFYKNLDWIWILWIFIYEHITSCNKILFSYHLAFSIFLIEVCLICNNKHTAAFWCCMQFTKYFTIQDFLRLIWNLILYCLVLLHVATTLIPARDDCSMYQSSKAQNNTIFLWCSPVTYSMYWVCTR